MPSSHASEIALLSSSSECNNCSLSHNNSCNAPMWKRASVLSVCAWEWNDIRFSTCDINF